MPPGLFAQVTLQWRNNRLIPQRFYFIKLPYIFIWKGAPEAMSGHHHYSPRPHNNNITSGFAYPSVRLVAILLLHFSVQLLSFDKALSVSIDNNIIGEPDIECLDREIRVWVKTRKFFGGECFHSFGWLGRCFAH